MNRKFFIFFGGGKIESVMLRVYSRFCVQGPLFMGPGLYVVVMVEIEPKLAKKQGRC